MKTYRAVSWHSVKIQPDKEILMVKTIEEPRHEWLTPVHARGRIQGPHPCLEPFKEWETCPSITGLMNPEGKRTGTTS